MNTRGKFRKEQPARAITSVFSIKQTTKRLLFAGIMAAATSPAFGAAEFKLGDDAGVTAGLGLRTSFSKTENGAPNGTSDSNDFNIDNARLFFSGHYGKVIKGVFNTDYKSDDSLRVLDAYIGFEFNDYFNIWLGRHLPPQDRANGYGPFYALPYTYPLTVSNYPQIENGRDNGVTLWGKLAGGKLVWAGGAYEGHNKNIAGSSGDSDKIAYSGRLIWHIWDPEPAPAYLAGGWFGGSKDLLSLGLAGYTQSDGVGSAAAPGRLRIWNVDALFEKKFGSVVPTLEGAYYQYKLGAVDCGSAEPGAPTTAACTAPAASARQVMEDGNAWLFGAALLFDQKVGWGQFQPFYRYQKFERSASNSELKTQDFGVNYIIKGPNAKVTAQYTKMEDTRPTPNTDTWRFLVGMQVIY
jgi:hypothetical protein